ncbi:MAG: ATP-binding protein [Candidatus Eremiobacteraeota bacterium]|nr:ATP-binding protein [Candidatus Eremiobacteraeota bacterium]
MRRDALDVLRRYGEPSSDFESCAVVLSELMSNAALHGPGGEIRVTLDWSAATPWFAVSDAGCGFVPAIGLPPPNREGGRGLYLVKTLAATPNVSIDESGCTVSVRLPVKRRRSSNVP